MNNFLKSHTLLLSLALSLSAILSFWALEKESCLEINMDEKLKIRAACKLLPVQKIMN